MSHIEVRLPGFFEPSLEVPSERVRIDFAAAPEEPDGPPQATDGQEELNRYPDCRYIFDHGDTFIWA